MPPTDLYLPRAVLEELGATNGNGTPHLVSKAVGSVDVAEVGGTGLQHYGGVLNEEYLPSLMGDRYLRVALEMVHDPILGGVLMAIDNLLRRVSWEFQPADDSGEAARWAEFMNEAMDDMSASWADTISSVFSFVPFGWSYHEIVYKRRQGPQEDTGAPNAPASSKFSDGLVGWRKLPIRSQESRRRWEIDPNGGIQGMWQEVTQGNLGTSEVLIPIRKGLLFRVGSRKDSPEPFGVLRTAYRPWWFKRRFEELEGIGIERDLAGVPIGGVPAEFLAQDADAKQKASVAAFREIVTNLRRNSSEGVVWPRAYDANGNPLFTLELLSATGKRQLSIEDAIGRKNMEMAISSLADWLLLGHEAVGSKALGSSKIDLFTTAMETWTNAVGDIFDAHATPRLLRLNGVGRDLAPHLQPGRVSQVDVEMFANAIGKLVQTMAITPDGPLEDWVRATVGAPAREEVDPEAA